MLFTTPEDRVELFRSLDRDPTGIPFGSAMEHARTTDLGVWGNESALRQDCARLMYYEIRRELLTTHRPELADINVEDILRSSVFAFAYEEARRPPNTHLHVALVEYGMRAPTPAGAVLVKPHPDIEYALTQKLVHRLLITDLTNHRMHLPRKKYSADW